MSMVNTTVGSRVPMTISAAVRWPGCGVTRWRLIQATQMRVSTAVILLWTKLDFWQYMDLCIYMHWHWLFQWLTCLSKSATASLVDLCSLQERFLPLLKTIIVRLKACPSPAQPLWDSECVRSVGAVDAHVEQVQPPDVCGCTCFTVAEGQPAERGQSHVASSACSGDQRAAASQL